MTNTTADENTDSPQPGLRARFMDMLETAALLLHAHTDDPTRSPLDPMVSKAEFDAVNNRIMTEEKEKPAPAAPAPR